MSRVELWSCDGGVDVFRGVYCYSFGRLFLLSFDIVLQRSSREMLRWNGMGVVSFSSGACGCG
jgi:hypothetical protein